MHKEIKIVPVSNLSVISSEEKHLLLHQFQGGFQDVSQETVIHAFLRRADAFPEKKALLFGSRFMSYQTLAAASEALAYQFYPYLAVSEENFAILYAGRSMEMIAGMFGIVRAGGAYVPVSPEYPPERVRFILADCRPKLFVSCAVTVPEEIRQMLADLSVPVISIPDISSTAQIKSFDVKHSTGTIDNLCPEQLVYMIYTSGTSGKPKGVMAEHRQLWNLVTVYTDIYGLSDQDCVLQFANYVFDQSVWDIFHILSVGGTLCLIPPELVTKPRELEAYCEKNKVTAASLTPGYLSVLSPSALPTLRLLDVGGEAPKTALLHAWSKGRIVMNTYGPTETCVNASSYRYQGEQGAHVPIGRAVPNTQIYILDGITLCGIGMPGELCIAGAGVTRGYLNRPELTAEKYVKNPFGDGVMYRSGDLARYLPDGNIEFLGRMDEQIKIRGFRIELGEIENSLAALDGVLEAAVAVRRDMSGACLFGFYTGSIEETQAQKELQYRLPAYMVPACLKRLSKMPLTINGKIDKQILLSNIPSAADKPHIEPETEAERVCYQVWKHVLGIKEIGVFDDFFELGGDSIRAISIVSLLSEQGWMLEIHDLMAYKQIRRIAGYMKKQQIQPAKPQEGEVLCTPAVDDFLRAQYPVPNHYNQSALLRLKKAYSGRELLQKLEAVRMRHGMLRAVLKGKAGDAAPVAILSANDAAPVYFVERTVSAWEELVWEAQRLQERLCLERGEIAAAAYFCLDHCFYLFLTIHHLCVDEVSWNILLEEFDGLLSGKSAESFAITAGYREWSLALSDYADTKELLSQRSYWESLLSGEYEKRMAWNAYFAPEKEKTLKTTKARFLVENRFLVSDVTQALYLLAKKYHTRMDAVLLAVLSETGTMSRKSTS